MQFILLNCDRDRIYLSGCILTGTCIPSTSGLAQEVMRGSGDSWRNLLKSAGVCILTLKCISAARPVRQSNPGTNQREGEMGARMDPKLSQPLVGGRLGGGVTGGGGPSWGGRRVHPQKKKEDNGIQ